MRLRAISLSLLALLSLGPVAACSDDDTGTAPSIEFGEGEVPDTFPDDFPIPPNARIGSSLIDRVNNKSELSMTVQTDMDVTVRFYTVGLVNEGYVVDSSEGNANTWTVDFSRGELAGRVVFNQQAGGTQLVASVNAT
jgi:hypothetical protein